MLRIFLALITLLASTSVFSGVVDNNLSLPQANTIGLNSGENNSTNEYSMLPLLEKEFITEVVKEFSEEEATPLQPQSENHTQSIDFSRPNRVSVLTHKLNNTPEYVLVYELLTEQLDVFANHEHTLTQAPPAWFMDFSDSSSRLSGWKDSNNLYTAKNTYHFS